MDRNASAAGGQPARTGAPRRGARRRWRQLPFDERLVFNKLLTGALRVGVSQRLVQQALAELSGIDIARIAQRMLGEWVPTPGCSRRCCRRRSARKTASSPTRSSWPRRLKPTSRASGRSTDWLLEWKWDGIRLQLLRRKGEVALWSRGEERLDGRFPEIEAAAMALPDGCVIDGELLAWRDGEARRCRSPRCRRASSAASRGRRHCATRRCACWPTTCWSSMARTCATQPLHAASRAPGRRCSPALDDPRIVLSPALLASDWPAAAAQRALARERGVEGLMLKRHDSLYQAGRRRGDWWKWKIDPLTIDAVMIYAQSGHGRRSTLYTDYTFGVWDGDTLVPVAKAYSGLDDKEILALDRWIRANTAGALRAGAQRARRAGVRTGLRSGQPSAAGTSPASRCAFRASCAGVATSRPRGRHAGPAAGAWRGDAARGDGAAGGVVRQPRLGTAAVPGEPCGAITCGRVRAAAHPHRQRQDPGRVRWPAAAGAERPRNPQRGRTRAQAGAGPAGAVDHPAARARRRYRARPARAAGRAGAGLAGGRCGPAMPARATSGWRARASVRRAGHHAGVAGAAAQLSRRGGADAPTALRGGRRVARTARQQARRAAAVEPAHGCAMRCPRCRCGACRRRWATWTRRARCCCPMCPMPRWWPVHGRARCIWTRCCPRTANASRGPATWACRSCSACWKSCCRCAPACCSPTPARRPSSGTRRWRRCGRRTRPRWRCITARSIRPLRRAAEQGLREGQLRCVVATSSLDLGVDFPAVDQVLQIGSPKGIARLLQRAGRARHRPGESGHDRVRAVACAGAGRIRRGTARAGGRRASKRAARCTLSWTCWRSTA